MSIIDKESDSEEVFFPQAKGKGQGKGKGKAKDMPMIEDRKVIIIIIIIKIFSVHDDYNYDWSDYAWYGLC